MSMKLEPNTFEQLYTAVKNELWAVCVKSISISHANWDKLAKDRSKRRTNMCGVNDHFRWQ